MKTGSYLAKLIGLALSFGSAMHVSAEWLESKDGKVDPFGKDLRINAYDNNTRNWTVSIKFSDQFDFSDFKGISLSIGDVMKDGEYFCGPMMLFEIGAEEVAPGGLGTDFSINSKTLDKCEITFNAEYQKKPVSGKLRFILRDGKFTGYKVEFEQDRHEEKPDADHSATTPEPKPEDVKPLKPEPEPATR